MIKLKEIRNKRKITQKELAEALQTTQQQYSKYETEKQELTANRIIKLCKILKCSADELLGIEDINNDYSD